MMRKKHREMSKVPTILQIVPDLQTGGAERTTVDVAEAIVNAGWKSLVVSQGGRMVPELEATGAVHFEMPVKSKNPWTMWRNSYLIERICKEHDVDLVHARSRAPAWSALWAAHRLNIPYVTTYHGIYKETNRFKAFYNSSMTRADKVIANSRFTANLVEKRDPRTKGKTSVIYRGPDLEAFNPENISDERVTDLRARWGVSDNRRVVMNLARLTEWKGQRVLIEATRQLLQRGGYEDVLVVLAGDDQGRESYRQSLELQIEESELVDNVRIVGHCSDVPAALAIADASVVASIEAEAFGRAAVEAQAAGVPVIVSNIGAVPETVLVPPLVKEEERTGWHFENGSVEELSNLMAQALDMSEEERAKLTKRAHDHVERSFTKQAMCAATLNVYRELLPADS
ncbi:glycosyltransferase family 4 protein [Pseudovibrio japonicus]|nr:glycosyltransferase family 4 protein [Pseudovibrio japonicus]